MLSCIYIKRESDKKSGRKTKKNVPTLFLFRKKKTCAKRKNREEEMWIKNMSPAKQFAQAFTKLDAWFESTRGLNLKEGGKEEEERKV